MYALHCRYVLYRYNKRCYGKFTLRQPLSLVLIVLSPATVAHVFIPGSTHPHHRSFLVYAGLPQTNEHKIISTNLLSPRPGWNRRWCYHGPAPITLCKSHRNLGTSPHSAIRHKPTSYGRIHKSAFSGRKSLNSTSFCPLSRSISRHFALLEAGFQLYAGQFTNFLTPRHRKRCIYAWLHSGIFFQF